MGAAGDDELHAVAVQSIQRIALADIYVVFELLGADIHRSCRDHLYDALLTGTLLAAETVLFLPALLDSALGEQFRDDFTGTKTALLGGAARGRSQMLEGELVVREFPEQVNGSAKSGRMRPTSSYFSVYSSVEIVTGEEFHEPDAGRNGRLVGIEGGCMQFPAPGPTPRR